ncbi:hypothetical protein D3C84_852400 [compost metagenome]
MKNLARRGPLDVVGVVIQMEPARLFAQGRHVLDQVTEGSVLIAAALGKVVVGQQPLPQPGAKRVDRNHIDRAQPQVLLERDFVHGIDVQQDPGEHQDLGPRGHVEQRRAGELFRPGAAVQGRDVVERGRGNSTQAQQPGR